MDCKVLLYYPYPEKSLAPASHNQKAHEEYAMSWYKRSARRNHFNFSNMFLFTIENPEEIYLKETNILDFGGGGGQFAMISKSFLPLANVYIADIDDYALLSYYKSMNYQIRWEDFENDATKFEYIFLNDVFEHVDNPNQVLTLLKSKLNFGGKIFIDTPIQFWLYPFLKLFSRKLFKKLMTGTVSKAHLQIWSKKSFYYVANKSGLKVDKFKIVSEFTMPAEHYLRNFGIKNKGLILIGKLFYNFAGFFSKNKIMAVLSEIK
jgi:2-polyprenyl-3-methyl-5-hydroxy-6-metoxy-1,4-benzoquinol methylase